MTRRALMIRLLGTPDGERWLGWTWYTYKMATKRVVWRAEARGLVETRADSGKRIYVRLTPVGRVLATLWAAGEGR